MKNKIKKIMACYVITAMSLGVAFVVNEKKIKSTEAWAGIAYVAAKKGASAEVGLALGVIGVWESTLQGAVWGAAFGNAAGAVVGAGVGL